MSLETKPNRLYQYDTLRCVLIFCVIVGHCLLKFSTPLTENLFRFFYSFHMPAFIFITGMMAKFDKRKILKHLLFPYVVFQILYLIADAMAKEEPITIQLFNPEWIMWYLLVSLMYYLLIPMLPEKGSKWMLPLIGIMTVIALVVGFTNSVGYYMSLSRFFVFFPFFLMGYYYQPLLGKRVENRKIKTILILAGALLFISGVAYIILKPVDMGSLYCATTYKSTNSTVWDRLIHMITGAGFIMMAIHLIPNIRIPVVSTIGQNTLPIFLLHGFVLNWLGKNNIFHFSTPINLALTCIFAIAMMALFGNKLMGKLFKIMF